MSTPSSRTITSVFFLFFFFATNPDRAVLNDRRLSAVAEQKGPFSEVQRCANVSSAKTEISIALQSHSYLPQKDLLVVMWHKRVTNRP